MRPYYLLHETLLRKNLQLIANVAERAQVEFILAFKAYALWKTFPIFREYITQTTASSPYEARLAYEEFGSKAHTYSPAYEEDSFDDILKFSSHITFNSLSQFNRFKPAIKKVQTEAPAIGLRINPEHCEIATAIYNPCAIGTRFGITADQLPKQLPKEITGFHCHCHCESGAEELQRTLGHIEKKFGHWLSQIKWLNLGGGHLVTRRDYNIDLLIDILKGFKHRYPHIHLILEPGSAFAWQTGELVSQVVDIVENNGIKTALLNVSFTCHMPDCLEMPYSPTVRGAKIIGNLSDIDAAKGNNVYRLGGNSCLSGDFMGYWRFPQKLKIGDTIVFEDMIHYTTVKTNMFNGICHPAIMMERSDGELIKLREFTYADYRNRMD